MRVMRRIYFELITVVVLRYTDRENTCMNCKRQNVEAHSNDDEVMHFKIQLNSINLFCFTVYFEAESPFAPGFSKISVLESSQCTAL